MGLVGGVGEVPLAGAPAACCCRRGPGSSPTPSFSGLGWLAALPAPLQQQNQGQSSWLPLYLSVVCLWVSCFSLSVFVSVSLPLMPESSSSSPPPCSSLSLVPGSQHGDPKQYSREAHPLFTLSERSRGRGGSHLQWQTWGRTGSECGQ